MKMFLAGLVIGLSVLFLLGSLAGMGLILKFGSPIKLRGTIDLVESNGQNVVQTLQTASESARSGSHSIRSASNSLSRAATVVGDASGIFGNIGETIDVNIAGYRPLARSANWFYSERDKMWDLQNNLEETRSNLWQTSNNIDSLANDLQTTSTGFRNTVGSIVEFMRKIERVMKWTSFGICALIAAASVLGLRKGFRNLLKAHAKQ